MGATWRAVPVLIGVLVAAAAPTPAAGYAASCAGAQANFATHRTALGHAIDDYACVAGSTGGDDCAAAFRRLRAAQSDFATAVADLHGSCPPE